MAVYYVASKLSIVACRARCLRSRSRNDKLSRNYSFELENTDHHQNFDEVCKIFSM